MQIPELHTWIGGKPEPSEIELPPNEALLDPNTGEVLATSFASSLSQVDRAISAADEAHTDARWRGRTVAERAEVLERYAKRLDDYAEDVAWLDALNSGVPISVTRLFAQSSSGTVRDAIQHAIKQGDDQKLEADGRDVRLRRVPWGATAIITPWNAPAGVALKKLAYALAAGATVVYKPSPASPFSAQLLVKAAMEAGVPEGVISLVLGGGEVGAALTSDPRIKAISLTGSVPTGRAIAAAAAPRFARLQFELGSSNPALVLDDADIEQTADSLVSGAMKLSGQWCEAPRHVFVARERLDELVEALRSSLSAMTIGSSTDESTTLGPVAYPARRAELHAQRDALAAAGAQVIEAADVPAQGSFVAPTLVVGEQLAPEGEIFGPILLIEPFDDVNAAIDRANAGFVGLAGYVYTTDEQSGRKVGSRFEVGEVKLNGSSILDMAPGSAQSFFGSSGIGGHGDRELLEFFTGVQVLGTDRAELPI